jgi:hypothetical protein
MRRRRRRDGTSPARIDVVPAPDGRSVAWVALAATLGACSDRPDPIEPLASAVSHNFFENSQRRDATALEAARVASFPGGGCTVFFLENTANKVYIGSARHCFEFAAANWCAEPGTIVDNSGVEGHCRRVVAADDHHDVVVLEVDIAHASTGDTTLRLASFVPKVGTKLVMLGYPMDEDPVNPREGALTTTENCWTLSDGVASPYVGQDNDVTIDLSAQHNCSTYGGNSGGPMYVAGTRDVIGLPFTYTPDDYQRRSASDLDTAAFLALTADFVGIHQAELVQAGIVSDGKPHPTSDANGDQAASKTPASSVTGQDNPARGDDDDDKSEKADGAPSKHKARPASATSDAPASACALTQGMPRGGGPLGSASAALLALALVRRRRR